MMVTNGSLTTRPACCRCGGDVRKRPRVDIFVCRQSRGPCGFRWTHGERDGNRMMWQATVTTADGKENYWSSPAQIERLGTDPGPGAYPSARMGAALFAGTKVLEVVAPVTQKDRRAT